ncbi:MAG: BACON domain-containing carbohydrate-binding protein [Acidobacteriota bacterium]
MMAMRKILLACLMFGWLTSFPAFCEEACVELANDSVPTLCAEEDNINMPFRGVLSRFVIEATHPQYAVTTYDCPPNFANCPPPSGDVYVFPPAQLKLYDDGTWVVWAYRESQFWRPQGMIASSLGGPSLADAHYVAVSKKVTGEDSWPQFLVLYPDGNLRLIPHPPVGQASVCFGSSVIVGPAAPTARPIAEIGSVSYRPSDNTLTIGYREGGSAILSMSVDRTTAAVTVDIGYPTSELPFATFRTMFVDQGNCDVARVAVWENGTLDSDSGVLDATQTSGDEFAFYRQVPSVHNMSAPDIRIGNFFQTCTYTVAPFQTTIPGTGATIPVTVTTTCGCAWAATSSDSTWLSFSPNSGSGSATVNMIVQPNCASARTATVTIAGHPYTVNQAADGPVITSITSKTSKPGSTACIKGCRFSPAKTANTVKFGRFAATVNKATTTRLTVTIPTRCKSGKTYGVTLTVSWQTSNTMQFKVR